MTVQPLSLEPLAPRPVMHLLLERPLVCVPAVVLDGDPTTRVCEVEPIHGDTVDLDPVLRLGRRQAGVVDGEPNP